MNQYEIFSINADGIRTQIDIIKAESIAYTPAGFALCNPGKVIDEIVYAVPSNCGVRKLNDA